MSWNLLERGRLIYWVATRFADGTKERIPMFFCYQLPWATDEGQRGDPQCRLASLGWEDKSHTGTYNPDDFELEDGTKIR